MYNVPYYLFVYVTLHDIFVKTKQIQFYNAINKYQHNHIITSHICIAYNSVYFYSENLLVVVFSNVEHVRIQVHVRKLPVKCAKRASITFNDLECKC